MKHHTRLRRLERAIEVVDGDIPLAPISLQVYGFMLGGKLSPAEVVAQLRQRWLAGERREWPELPEFLALRDFLLENQRDRERYDYSSLERSE